MELLLDLTEITKLVGVRYEMLGEKCTGNRSFLQGHTGAPVTGMYYVHNSQN